MCINGLISNLEEARLEFLICKQNFQQQKYLDWQFRVLRMWNSKWEEVHITIIPERHFTIDNNFKVFLLIMQTVKPR